MPLYYSLHPLLVAFHDAADGKGRVIQHDHVNKNASHGLPPVEALASTLRDHLLRAGVTRAALHLSSEGSRKLRFYELRSTGITHEVLAGTDHVRIMQRAGHKSFKTTRAYVRAVDDVRLGPNEVPFPPLPEALCAIIAPRNKAFSTDAPDSSVGNISGKGGVPNGIRTRVTALKGPCPGPG